MAKKAKQAKDDTSKIWTLFSFVAAFGAARLAKTGIDKGWQVTTGKKPPENPADPDVDISEAIAWAVASGTIVALVRMLASRRAANYYLKSTGQLPPPLRKDNQKAGSNA